MGSVTPSAGAQTLVRGEAFLSVHCAFAEADISASLSEDFTVELALILLCTSEKTKLGLSRGQNWWE